MKNILSCDWGTSNFRIRLIGIENEEIIDEISTAEGISSTHNNWINSGIDREGFYSRIIQNNISALQRKAGMVLEDIPVLISGMASSSLGIRELNYAGLPFSSDGSSAGLTRITVDGFKHEIFLISGVRSENDVMRGEETQWLGLIQGEQLKNESELLFILPGTHAKHLEIRSRQLVNLRTYMTGEFFNLLSTSSVLKNSVVHGESMNTKSDEDAFIEGVKAAQGSSILHESFLVRTNELFQKFSRHQNTFYLSGLLIGSELQDIAGSKIVLAAAASLLKPYQLALECLGAGTRVITISPGSLDKAVIQGQLIIFNQNIQQ